MKQPCKCVVIGFRVACRPPTPAPHPILASEEEEEEKEEGTRRHVEGVGVSTPEWWLVAGEEILPTFSGIRYHHFFLDFV